VTDNGPVDEFEQAYGRALGAAGGAVEVDMAASVLAAAADGWDAAGRRTADRVVRQCLERGWGVADLVRMAGRELTPRHRQLAEALAEADQDAEAGAGARAGAGAGAGPGAGARAGARAGAAAAAGAGGRSGARAGAPDTGIAGFARRERLDRFSAATVLVELLCLYGRLPRLAVLAPSAAAPDRGGSKVLGRVRALLAKAESTGFPDEAEALSAKAHQLMARHSIDEALLAADGSGAGGPGTRRIGVDRPYESAKALLLDAVAAANRCESVWSADFGFSTVVGHAADLDAVELLYTSLLVQADRALHRGPSRRRDFRESFLIAYSARIRERLTAATEDEVRARDDAPDLLPALAARDLAVRDTTRRLFPATTTSRVKGRDAEGWRHGETAADRASL
jgi:Protein of unknown function (DUF2786)